MTSLRHSSLLLLSLFAIAADSARADVYHLKSGGHISGVLIDRGAKGEYVVETKSGAVVTLLRKQVRRVVREDAKHLEYAKRSRSMPDTVDAHRELASWCKRAKMSSLADHHLRRILELDPTDKQARESLGYQQVDGRWLTRDEIMAERGLYLYKGEYRTAQDIALREAAKKRKQAETDWLRQLSLWRRWLDNRRANEAIQSIEQVSDPYAAPALVKLLEREEDPQVRELLTATLAPLRHPLAVTTLVDFSLYEPDPEVRLQCLDYLLEYHQPVSLTPYINALHHAKNEIVNRAAEALEHLGNPDAISPLIDALITTHKFKNKDAPPGDTNVSFSPGGGGGGLSLGGKAKIFTKDLQNPLVARALVELSGGQNFEFNKQAWRRWFVNQQQRDFVDTRRDN